MAAVRSRAVVDEEGNVVHCKDPIGDASVRRCVVSYQDAVRKLGSKVVDTRLETAANLM